MEDYFLNTVEEQAVDTIKSYFYDPNFSVDSIKSALSPIASARQSKVLEDAYIQTSAEQAQRRRYIAATLSPDEEMEKSKAEILSENLYGYTTSNQQARLLSEVGINIGDEKISDDVMEQAKIYQVTNKNIVLFANTLLITQKINPIFPSLDSLDTNSLQELVSSISTYMSLANEGRKENPTYNPLLSSAIVTLLTKARLHLLIENMVDINRKLDFLMSIATVSKGIAINRLESASDILEENVLKISISKLMYMYNTSFEYAV